MTSFNDVDSALADIIAYNAADSIDAVVASVLTSGTNIIYAGTATSTNTITSSMKMSVQDIREAVTELRTNKALPRIGELYAAYSSPIRGNALFVRSETTALRISATDIVSTGRTPDDAVGAVPDGPFAKITLVPADRT